jgi:hypothetical protein
MPFAMQRQGRKHGGMQQPYGSMPPSGMQQPYGSMPGFPNQQFRNQQSGSSGPFSLTNQQAGQPMGFGGNQLGGRHGRHNRNRQAYMQGGGYIPSYTNYGGDYGSGHVPTMVVREYSFPHSASPAKSEDAHFMVELLAKQEKLVIDKPDATKSLEVSPLVPLEKSP